MCESEGPSIWGPGGIEVCDAVYLEAEKLAAAEGKVFGDLSHDEQTVFVHDATAVVHGLTDEECDS